jgi:hypothetical protein
LALACVVCATLGCVCGIAGNGHDSYLFVLSLVVLITYVAGVYYGFESRNGFYLSIIPFSVIIIIAALLIRENSSAGMFLFTSMFIIVAISLVITNLITLLKKWQNEQKD